MRRLSWACVVAALAIGPAWAVDPSVEAMKAKLLPQERILLALVLAQPGLSGRFAQDARQPTDAAVAAWRGRIAVGARDYLAAPHRFDERARTVQAAVEPGEWAALMVSLRLLADGGIADQAKFRLFVAMIDNANDDLKDGDSAEAKKVTRFARGRLVEAINEYLASEPGRRSLIDGEAERRRQAEEELARRAAQREAAEREAAERAAAERAATERASRPVPTTTPPPPAASRTRTATTGGGRSTALAQARAAGAGGGAGADRAFDGSDADRRPGGVVAITATELASPLARLTVSSTHIPNLVVAPPAPKEGDDMAELRRMKSKVSGGKKWWAAGAGGLLGGLLGFLLAGPVGAAVGAAVAAGGGLYLGKFLWG